MCDACGGGGGVHAGVMPVVVVECAAVWLCACWCMCDACGGGVCC